MGREYVTREHLIKLHDELRKILAKYKNRIDYLEKRVAILERESDSPWKMPFD